MEPASYTTFDILSTPLEGTNLIEASAGTGKTYTLTGLYLRLLLENGLSVDRILVVTFTEAATGELKDRIRNRLRSALLVLSGHSVEDPFLEDLAAHLDNPRRALLALQQALRDFDRAAIFTIHGFCRRVLTEHAFESSVAFDTDVIADSGFLKRELVEDFWRRHASGASSLFVRYALSRGFTPQGLRSLTRTVQGPLRPSIVPRVDIPKTDIQEEAFLEAFRDVQRAWPTASGKVEHILLNHEGLNRNRYRKTSVPNWLRAMETFTRIREETPSPMLFQSFEKYTSSHLEKAVKNGHAPPAHDFFDRCETLLQRSRELSEIFNLRLLGLKAKLFETLDMELAARKAEKNVQSFDDLLLNVRRALEGPGGERLCRALRSRFHAALVDEFQDTDPLQYAIFKDVFSGTGDPLFLIGDPKQAIYGFRGADIFAYLQASRESAQRYTLATNYRSEPGLVRAVNALYRAHPRPFLFEGIPFHAAEPALDRKAIPTLTVDGKAPPPLEIWFAEAGEPSGRQGTVTKQSGEDRIPRAVCAEIARLVSMGRSGRARIGEDPLCEGDIAVLLRTNREAQILQRALAAQGLPAVLYSTSSLFDTQEAMEISRLMAGLAHPERADLLRAALATDILGLSAEAVEALAVDPASWEKRRMRLLNDHEVWREQGFMCMFRRVLRREEVLPRWLAGPNGERRVTNLLHLSEVLHHAERDRKLGLEGLVQWLAEQRDESTRGTEEHPLRLESDGNAVKLVTIHKSKGLEYPVVFCPFLWTGSRLRHRDAPFLFHENAQETNLTLDLGTSSEERERHRALAENEALAENLRILYVAITRARNRCILVWGRFNQAETSAPAYLFHTRDPEAVNDPLTFTANRFHHLDDTGARADLEAIQDRSGGTICIEPLDRPLEEVDRPALKRPPVLVSRTFQGRMDRSWSISSFSSLTSSISHAEEIADRDAESENGEPELRRLAEPSLKETPPQGFFAFPRGTRSGICLHALLESVDFKYASHGALSPRVREMLLAHGFDPAWESDVTQMLQDVLTTPLDPQDPGLRLERLSPQDRLNELAFTFPLNSMSVQSLRKIISRHDSETMPHTLPERVGRLRFAPVRGFMRGFIDLVFQYNDRFYLLDWKSNDLGPTPDHYALERLQTAMLDHLYPLQYLIYTLALDRYLALRIPGYRYDTHFGGVFYVFLRGVNPARGAGSGVVRERPPVSMVRELRRELIPENSFSEIRKRGQEPDGGYGMRSSAKQDHTEKEGPP
ncbi:MAG: exodeoxyribonuclease V subunit beta [Desulfobacteraceae bacterium]|jgi:exodeoxyribonuclease V beta subunit